MQKEKRQCVFISPHLDDAAFSAGVLMKKLSAITKVKLINIFTKGGVAPYTFSARRYLTQCGYGNFDALIKDRKKEDKRFSEMLGIENINLEFEDALYRKKHVDSKHILLLGNLIPEAVHIYPVYRLNIKGGNISPHDNSLIDELGTKLKSMINDSSIVFCPDGVGKHVDHMLVKEVCSNNFDNVIYWSDYPYNLKEENEVSKYNFEITDQEKYKKEIIKTYRTQFNAIFSDQKIPVVNEKFLVNLK